MDDKGILETLEDSYLELVDGAVNFLPNLFVALVLLLVGVSVAGAVSRLVGKFVNYVETSKPVTSTVKSLGMNKIDIDGVVAIFTRWAILLIFLSASVDVLGLPALSETFDSLVSFVPNILAASVIAALALVVANIVYDMVNESAEKANVAASKTLATASRVAVLVFGLPLAAAQLGLDLTILNNNITVIVGGFMLAFGLAFGLGGKDVAGKMLDDAYKGWKKK